MKQSPSYYFILGLGFLLSWAALFNGQSRAASSWDGKSPVAYVLSVDTDHADAIYHKGEKVTFTIKLQHDQQPAANETVDWVITKDGMQPPLQKGTATLQNGMATVTGSLDEPGFLRCDVTYKQGKDTFVAPAAAAIAPLEIKPSLPVPDDFDSFWDAQKKKLAAIPVNAKLTSVLPPPDRPGVETFDFQADCVGAPASGYYARPAGAKPKSCPALLFVEGAGVLSADILTPTRWAQKGFIAIDLNAHGIPNGKPREFYSALAAGELKDYRTHGRESRDTYYFLGMFLRELRALDFLTAQPEWDGHTLIMEGVSQGGAQAIAATALDPRVTFMAVSNPAMCDHTGMLVGRIAGWPKVVPVGTGGKPDPAVVETSRYFDSVNFATRIKVPVYFDIGFIDLITPATGSYAAYNNVTSKKVVVNEPAFGHGRDNPTFWLVFGKVILDEADAQRAKTKANAAP